MSDRLFLGTRKGLFVLDRKPSGWAISDVHFLGDNVSMFLPDGRTGTWFAALNLGHFGAKLRKSDDQGKNWTELKVPAYAEGAEIGPPPFPGPDGQPLPPKPATLKQIFSLTAGAADQQPGLLWAGTIPGGLFRSTDSGESWDLVESLWNEPDRLKWFGGGTDEPGMHSVCVDPQDSNRVAIAVSCGGAWITEDGGDSWTCSEGMRAEFMPPDQQFDPVVQDPHLMVQCRDEPDKMWVQHHNGIFKSTNRGRNWTEIENAAVSNFGFAVAVHPAHGDTAWFVPCVKDEKRVPVDGKLVVTKTTDGGRSWTEQRNGLPQEHCYDIIFRHALAIDETGDRLAMGSSTGGFWTTDNGGDSWNCFSTNLPQIYCVRFE